MEEKKYYIKQQDGYTTQLYSFNSKKPVKISLLVLHGMAEHHSRYKEFARFLTNHGIDVFLYDQRGHGMDKPKSELGYFTPNKGDEVVVDDAIRIINFIKELNKDHKFILMGHSMGSLITRNVIQKDDSMDGVIICGTANPIHFIARIGLGVFQLISLGKNKLTAAPICDKILFKTKTYNKYCTNTQVDWLSRDKKVVHNYCMDPYCGFICSYAFYMDLLRLTIGATNKSNIRKTRKDLPINIISGTSDPVGGNGRDVKRLIKSYQKEGYSNLQFTLYEGCRHELLNELNKHEVMNDLATYLLSI